MLARSSGETTFAPAVKSSASLAALALLAFLPATPTAAGAVTVFENVRIFDGKSDRLTAPQHVLVRGKVIEKISATPLPVDRGADTVVIAGEGRTLMPGLIDAHTHIMFASLPQSALLTADLGFIAVAATRTADEA